MLLDAPDFGDRLLSLISAAMPLDGCCFYRVADGQAVNHRLSALAPYWLEKYRSYFWQIDPLHPGRLPSSATRVRTFDRGTARLSAGEREYCAGFLAPQGTRFQAELYFRRGATTVAGASLLRNAEQGAFTGDNIRLLEQLVEFSGFGTARDTTPELRWFEQIALSTRECEVARLMGRALSNKDISRQLEIALPTVKTHVGRILGKAGAANRAAFVHKVARLGAAAGSDRVGAA